MRRTRKNTVYHDYLQEDTKDQLMEYIHSIDFFRWCLTPENLQQKELIESMVAYLSYLGSAVKDYENQFYQLLSPEKQEMYTNYKQQFTQQGLQSYPDYINLQNYGYPVPEDVGSNPIQDLLQKQKQYQKEARGVTITEKRGKKLETNTFVRYVLTRVHLLQNRQGVYYIYSKKGVYVKAETSLLIQLFRYVLDEYDDTLWTKTHENSYMAALVGLVPIDEAIDQDDVPVINLQNGLYLLKEGRFQPHTPEIYTSHQLSYSYLPEATCPKFMEFLTSIFEEDQERIDLMQQLLGYFFLREIKIQKAFIFLGSGSNGKSVLANVITQLLGKEQTSTTPLSKLTGNFAFQNIAGKLANISGENEFAKNFNTQDFKALTSGDMVEVERKYEAATSQYIHAKLILLMNKMMDSTDYSDGYYRRLQIIPFRRTYVERRQGEEAQEGVFYMEPNLIEELTKELPGILNFALVGLAQLQQNGYCLPKCQACEEELERYKQEQNPMIHYFDEQVMYTEGEKIKRSVFTNHCRLWIGSQEIFSHRNYTSAVILQQLREEAKRRNLDIQERKIQGDYYLTNLSFRPLSLNQSIELDDL